MKQRDRKAFKEQSTDNNNKKKRLLPLVWLLLGISCFAYFCGLTAYAGFHNVFYFFWVFAGAFFLVCAWMSRTRFIKRKLSKRLRILLGVLLGAGVFFFGLIECFILSGFNRVPEEEPQYLIVLGAHVDHGVPSRVLAKRLDAAYDYAAAHPQVKVVVSGGQGGNETTTEASVMAEYLERRGIAGARILLEEQATDTNENLRFSMKLTGADAKIAVVSNGFHVFRAVHIARHIGFRDVQGLAAAEDKGLLPANMVREFFGVGKDWVCGNMKLFPLWQRS